MLATVQSDGVLTVQGTDLDGLDVDKFHVPGYDDTEGGDCLADVALIEHGLYRTGPWMSGAHDSAYCTVAALPDVVVRVLALDSGTEYGTANESWKHAAFIGWRELGAVTGQSGHGLKRLQKQLAEVGSATLRLESGYVVRLIARIGE